MGLGFGVAPPPQPHNTTSRISPSADTSLRFPKGRVRSPKSIAAQKQFEANVPGEWSNAIVRGTVVTVTIRFEATFWSTGTLPGTEQFASVTAKLHLIVATPVNPAPPIDKT